MNIKLKEIKIGMVLKCLNCRKPIVLNDDAFVINKNGEYIRCPHCYFSHDVQLYHRLGEEAKD